MVYKVAVIDLGTNTFQLIIAEKSSTETRIIEKRSLASKIGQGGIEQGMITEQAIQRAVDVLKDFSISIVSHGVSPEKVLAFGTSAIRNAKNKQAFTDTVFEKTGINISVIDGNQEASYIYNGVRTAVDLGENPKLIVDIGGGSVEFVIGNNKQVFWQQSFEIGGQRLMDKFQKSDPISAAEQNKTYNYLEEQLIPLANAIHQYHPDTLVGSSGTFDTLIDLDFAQRTNSAPPKDIQGFTLPIETFYKYAELLLTSNREERLLIPGMIELRADMIQVAIILIAHLLRRFSISKIEVSKASLKEGVLATL